MSYSFREVRKTANKHKFKLFIISITLASFILRIYQLGARPYHYDEARVGYGVLRYMATGQYEYRPVVHGPFMFHAENLLMTIFGSSDFTGRLTAALAGSLLPASVWLFRDYVSEKTLSVTAVILAVNPVLLYYSRFLRSDILTATFMFIGFGLILRYLSTNKTYYAYSATAVCTLALTTKENAILYPVTWIGATLVILAYSFVLDKEFFDIAVDRIERVRPENRSELIRLGTMLTVHLSIFLAIIIFWFAPRPELYNPLSSFNTILTQVFIEKPNDVFSLWVSGNTKEKAEIIEFFNKFTGFLVATSLLTISASAAGIVYSILSRKRHHIVLFLGACGVASILGYPFAMDIAGAWALVHMVVPLSIAAGFGVVVFAEQVGITLGEVTQTISDTNLNRVMNLIIVILLISSYWYVGVGSLVYENSSSGDNPLVQYAQPQEQNFDRVMGEIESEVSEGDGSIVYYGKDLYMENESNAYTLPASGEWYHRLPLPWYFEKMGAEDIRSATMTDSIKNYSESGELDVVVMRSLEDNKVSFEAVVDEDKYHIYEIQTRTVDYKLRVYILKDKYES